MWDMGGMLGSGDEAGTGSISAGRYWPSGPMGPATQSGTVEWERRWLGG